MWNQPWAFTLHIYRYNMLCVSLLGGGGAFAVCSCILERPLPVPLYSNIQTAKGLELNAAAHQLLSGLFGLLQFQFFVLFAKYIL